MGIDCNKLGIFVATHTSCRTLNVLSINRGQFTSIVFQNLMNKFENWEVRHSAQTFKINSTDKNH